MNKLIKNTAIITLIFAIILPTSSTAEFICRQDIGYKWKKDKEDGELFVRTATVESKGGDEAAAKRGLEVPANKELSKAQPECAKEHENTAGCIASKLASMSAILDRAGFSQKKNIEDAIVTDCNSKLGSCISALAQEAKCFEATKSEAGADGASGATGGKEAAKGKKK